MFLKPTSPMESHGFKNIGKDLSEDIKNQWIGREQLRVSKAQRWRSWGLTMAQVSRQHNSWVRTKNIIVEKIKNMLGEPDLLNQSWTEATVTAVNFRNTSSSSGSSSQVSKEKGTGSASNCRNLTEKIWFHHLCTVLPRPAKLKGQEESLLGTVKRG